MFRLLPWASLILGIWPSTLAFGQAALQPPTEAIVQTPPAPEPTQIEGEGVGISSSLRVPAPSLGGPVAELVVGGVVLISASLATTVVVGLSQMDICLADDDEDCDAHSDNDPRMERRALGVGIPVALLGAALLVHGAYRTRAVRQQRRMRAALGGMSLDVAWDGAHISWQTSF